MNSDEKDQNNQQEFIKVYVRVRKLFQKDGQKQQRIFDNDHFQNQTISLKNKDYTFDHIVNENVNQQQFFQLIGPQVVENCFQGINSCVFAYGQTGSGKTYTMLGGQEEQNKGLIQRVFEQIFQKMDQSLKQTSQTLKQKQTNKFSYNLSCSFFEIYNEQIFDLLSNTRKPLQLREHQQQGVYIDKLYEKNIQSIEQLIQSIKTGQQNRSLGQTEMNFESSRSHSIFQLIIQIQEQQENGQKQNIKSKLSFVDLAGSERQKSTKAKGQRLKEANNINKSLSVLGQVITTLSEQKQNKFIPYRNSKLTYVLKDSLGGTSRTYMIATISPDITQINETQSTFQFASRVKLITTNISANNSIRKDDPEEEIQRLKQHISLLEKKLNNKNNENLELNNNKKIKQRHKQQNKIETEHNIQQIQNNQIEDQVNDDSFSFDPQMEKTRQTNQSIILNNQPLEPIDTMISEQISRLSEVQKTIVINGDTNMKRRSSSKNNSIIKDDKLLELRQEIQKIQNLWFQRSECKEREISQNSLANNQNQDIHSYKQQYDQLILKNQQYAQEIEGLKQQISSQNSLFPFRCNQVQQQQDDIIYNYYRIPYFNGGDKLF